jgi:Lipopolysaccharide export system permease LptF/LptG
MTGPECLRGRMLLRFAERVFDLETVERVLLPAFADLQHECENGAPHVQSRRLVQLRAYWGVWKTLGVCAVGDVVHNRDGIRSSLGTRTVVFLVIVVAVLMAPSVSWMISFGSTYGAAAALAAGALLLPSNMLVALPVAFFFALAMFRAPDVPTARLLPSAAAGTLACAVIVLALLMVVAPTTNQAYRTRVFAAIHSDLTDGPPGPLLKGLADMTLPELNAHIRDASSSRQAELARAHRHERFAFVATVFVLGLLGFALAGRWRSRVATRVVALSVIVFHGVCFGYGTVLDSRDYPAAYGTWTANGAFLVIGLLLLRARQNPARTISHETSAP